MKNKNVVLFLLAMSFCICSCEKKIQTTKGKVRNIKTDSTMVLSIDKYDIEVDTRYVRYPNGAAMAGDSVVMNYIGDLRDKKVRALILNLIPQKGNYMEIGFDPSRELKTSEKTITPEQQQQTDAFMEMSKRHGH